MKVQGHYSIPVSKFKVI